MAACRSCNASIVWATSASTGKPIPFDAEPVAGGNFTIVKGTSRPVTPEDRKLHRPLYTSHFATCPDAKDWRRS